MAPKGFARPGDRSRQRLVLAGRCTADRLRTGAPDAVARRFFGGSHSTVLATCVLSLPGRGLCAVAHTAIASALIRTRARVTAVPRARTAPPLSSWWTMSGTRPWSSRSDPALTVGVIQPIVVVNAAFCALDDRTHRGCFAHERAQRRGRHGVLEATPKLLLPGLMPLPLDHNVRRCVRRDLEALADDATAQQYDRRGRGLLARARCAGPAGTSGPELVLTPQGPPRRP